MNLARPTSISNRLRAKLPFKLLLTLLLYPAVYGPYHFLQLHHFFTPTELRPGLVDQWIPFDDRFVWIYLSVYLLMPIGPILMTTREQLRRYAAGILLISLVADTVFVLHPTICPRPNPVGSGRLYQLLVAIDNPFHGFPSLHAAFAIYSALCAERVLRVLGWRSCMSAAAWTWATLILYSTLATKQHTLADIVFGGVLGTLVYFAVFRAPFVLKEKTSPWLIEPKPSQTIQPIV
ncbi:MAG TPA: phosphatase PAP2 family protein [Verrucomicrobiae bacterium]|jgi:membrane-associated phospholipid phosphatase|nr:phosphatase PAP2 family protein [Verrucomicrobiae bacterium]